MDGEWCASCEELMSRYCDEASVREKLHRASFYKFSCRNKFFQLPIIICSALSGSIQLLSKQFPDVEGAIITGTATLSIFTSILGSLHAYLKYGAQVSAHEAAEVSWQSFHNRIKHCLSLRRDLRPDQQEFTAEIHTAYERLFEISPILDQTIINQIKKSIENASDNEFRVPNYLNGLTHTEPFA